MSKLRATLALILALVGLDFAVAAAGMHFHALPRVILVGARCD